MNFKNTTMEKESIITISQTHQEADFNWAIKR
jgi:hypothetical protein